MIIGLVSEPKVYTRKILIRGMLGLSVSDKVTNAENPFDLEVGILPFSRRQMDKMSARSLSARIIKLKKRLIHKGAQQVLISRGLKKLCDGKGIVLEELSDINGKNLFLRLAPFCIRELSKKCGIDLMKKPVCIRDAEMDRISEYLMRALCFDVKNLTICTKSKGRALRICEAFYDETGFLVRVADSLPKDAAITIDVDRCALLIGRDLCVTEAEFGYNLGGYDVSHTDVAVCLPDFTLGATEWVFSYKGLLGQ